MTDDSDLPDARDGLTRKERVVLVTLAHLERERGGRSVPLPMLYGRVLEHVDMSIGELQRIVQRLAGRLVITALPPRASRHGTTRYKVASVTAAKAIPVFREARIERNGV